MLEDRPHHPLCPPTSQPPQPILSSSRPRFLSPRFCVVGRFCVLYRKKKPRGKWRCPLVVSVSVIITASLDASKLWSVGLSSEPEIVHGCVRRRAGPPPVCRSRMRTRRACASCDANRRSMWSMSRVCDPPPVQVCLVSCPASPQIELAVFWLLAKRKPSAPVGRPGGSEGCFWGLSRRIGVPGNGNRRQRGVLSGI